MNIFLVGKSGGDRQQHKDPSNKSEDPSIKEKVKIVIEMTQRSEEEVCLALHECDYDTQLAINMLYETLGTVSICIISITTIILVFII